MIYYLYSEAFKGGSLGEINPVGGAAIRKSNAFGKMISLSVVAPSSVLLSCMLLNKFPLKTTTNTIENVAKSNEVLMKRKINEGLNGELLSAIQIFCMVYSESGTHPCMLDICYCPVCLIL